MVNVCESVVFLGTAEINHKLCLSVDICLTLTVTHMQWSPSTFWMSVNSVELRTTVFYYFATSSHLDQINILAKRWT